MRTANLLGLYIAQAINYLAPLAVLPYIIHQLGPSIFGQIAIAQAACAYAYVFMELGTTPELVRRLAAENPDSANSRQLHTTALVLRLLAGVLLLGPTFAATLLLLPEASAMYLAGAYAAALFTALYPTWYFLSFERSLVSSAIQSATKLGALPCYFLLVKTEEDGFRYLLITAAATAFAAIAAHIHIWRAFDERPTPRQALLSRAAEVVRDSRHLLLGNLSVAFYSNLPMLMLGRYAATNEVGQFAGAIKLLSAAQGMITPLGLALAPGISRHRRDAPEKMQRFVRAAYAASLVFAIAIAIVLIAAPGPVVHYLLGDEYAGTVNLLPLLAPLPLLWATSNIFGTTALPALGRHRLYFSLLMAIAAFSLITNWYAVSGFGLSGAVFAVLAVESLAACLLYLGYRRSRRTIP